MLEVRAKGINIEHGDSKSFGSNYMFRITRKSSKKIRCSKVGAEIRTYDRKTFCCFELVPADATSVSINLILQSCKGEAWLDHVTVSGTVYVDDDGGIRHSCKKRDKVVTFRFPKCIQG